MIFSIRKVLKINKFEIKYKITTNSIAKLRPEKYWKKIKQIKNIVVLIR